MYTRPAKLSPLGPPYHYHETGDGPDFNTTDSVPTRDHLHDHGFATGPNQSIATGKASGPHHIHELDLGVHRPGRKPMITGIGKGGENLILKDHIREAAKLLSSLISELHSSAMFHRNSNHDTPTWKKCKSWHCSDVRKMLDDLGELAPVQNPHALRQYRANLKRLQKAIKSEPPVIG